MSRSRAYQMSVSMIVAADANLTQVCTETLPCHRWRHIWQNLGLIIRRGSSRPIAPSRASRRQNKARVVACDASFPRVAAPLSLAFLLGREGPNYCPNADRSVKGEIVAHSDRRRRRCAPPIQSGVAS
jgi:hypothetical protein